MEREVIAYLTKARESLETAESEFSFGRYNSCANRSYYACFQGAIAALIQEGIRPSGNWGHDFVQGQFVGMLIERRMRYSSDLRRTLTDNRILREQADYESELVSEIHASRSLRRARTFVKAIEQRGVR